MKEKPILFSGAMVCAILSGRKTQTRRVVKGIALDWLSNARFTPEYVALPENYLSPYGFAGDGLWVRETWAEVPRAVPHTDEDLPMRLDDRILVYQADPEWNGARQFLCADGCLRWARPERWKPSIHMPRWACRIEPEITDVRIERLQEISESDATAEGTPHSLHLPAGRSASENYAHLWDCLNEDRGFGWNTNPWVWVVEFKRIER